MKENRGLTVLLVFFLAAQMLTGASVGKVGRRKLDAAVGLFDDQTTDIAIGKFDRQ